MEKMVIIKAYRADNGIFRIYGLQKYCKDDKQQLIVVVVIANFTNRITEKRMRDLQDLVLTELIYSSTK